jgi:hypothetical protein
MPRPYRDTSSNEDPLNPLDAGFRKLQLDHHVSHVARRIQAFQDAG